MSRAAGEKRAEREIDGERKEKKRKRCEQVTPPLRVAERPCLSLHPPIYTLATSSLPVDNSLATHQLLQLTLPQVFRFQFVWYICSSHRPAAISNQ